MLVQKRNGKYVEFDKQRIIDAINKAFVEVDGDLYENETSRDAAEDTLNTIVDYNKQSNKKGIIHLFCVYHIYFPYLILFYNKKMHF